MKGNVIVILLMVFLFMGGSANAGITILPTYGSEYVDENGTIYAPVGKDAYDEVGLSVDFTGFARGSSFNITIYDHSWQIVFNNSNLGLVPPFVLPEDNYKAEIHWIPENQNQLYHIEAEASGIKSGENIYGYDSTDIFPIPELSTAILASTGLIGLAGLFRLHRKNK